MPLRRLTKYSKLELDREKAQLEETIAGLTALLESDGLLRARSPTSSPRSRRRSGRRGGRCCWSRRAQRGRRARPRRWRSPTTRASCCCRRPACWRGRRPRTRCPRRTRRTARRTTSSSRACRATARGEVGAVTSAGRDGPAARARHARAAPDVDRAVALRRRAAGGVPRPRQGRARRHASSARGRLAGLALGTAQGVVKRVTADYPPGRTEWEVIGLRDGDSVVGAVELPHERRATSCS